jgi:hypothetical protein
MYDMGSMSNDTPFPKKPLVLSIKETILFASMGGPDLTLS